MMPAKADTMICMNFKCPWLCVREALPLLQRTAAAGDRARIVIVGSIGGLRPNAGNGMYSATKTAGADPRSETGTLGRDGERSRAGDLDRDAVG
jgi:NAD(P)-dependent dehydrogenase (short-subunit alcohol dehydrogenase family)